VRVDGLPVVDTSADLAASRLLYPLMIDETGAAVGLADGVWTGTGLNGEFSGLGNCSDWTSADDADNPVTGTASAGTDMFTRFGPGGACDPLRRLYCFGTDLDVAVTAEAQGGDIAFVTDGIYITGAPGGFSIADSACQGEASAAGLPGTYRALIAGNGSSAQSRFNMAGSTWKRVDGVVLAPTREAFFTTNAWASSLSVTAVGDHLNGAEDVWAGAIDMATNGSDATTCFNWQTRDGDSSARGTGFFGHSDVARAFGQSSISCDSNFAHLYCLQQ
jgi:hypothetical protein